MLGAKCMEHVFKSHKVNFVLTDKGSLNIIKFCKANKIPFFSGNPRNGVADEFLSKFRTDVLLSLNYLFMIDQPVLLHPKKYAINFHGSLLPKYRGRTPHVWAIINNEMETGITAHFISNECDAGDIIHQEKIKIKKTDTGAALLAIFNQRFPKIIAKVIKMIEKEKIVPVKQVEEQATYFNKRTPADGLINWNWQKERIFNWVRALSKPYPGAFSFYEGKKVIIHKIAFSDHGFKQDDENGKVLDVEKLIIKTSNGAIRLMLWESDGAVEFKPGQIFNDGY